MATLNRDGGRVKRFKSILVAIDSRAQDHPALQWATSLAEYNKARLTIVDVVPELSSPFGATRQEVEMAREAIEESKTRSLEALATSVGEKGVSVETRVLSGRTSVAIIRAVLKDGHDLVVRTTKGVRSRRFGWLGTTSRRLLRKCPCPVWLVRPNGVPRFSCVLAAVEPTPHDDAHAEFNHCIMDLAISIAEYQGGQVHVVHAWDVFGSSIVKSRMRARDFGELEATVEAKVMAAFDTFLASRKLKVGDANVHLLRGDASLLIPPLVTALGVDLIVMGTIARTGVQGLLMGNTAEVVLDRVECPVLAVKPQGFVSPVVLSD